MFSKLDLSQAYLQVPLEKESQRYLVINTNKGFYTYKRLPLELRPSAPAIFQYIIDGILQGLAGVCTHLDDMLVTGKKTDEHIKTLMQS